MTDRIEIAIQAYAREVVLSRRRSKINRSDLHPGDIGLDIDGDIQVVARLVNRGAMKAALEVADKA